MSSLRCLATRQCSPAIGQGHVGPGSRPKQSRVVCALPQPSKGLLGTKLTSRRQITGEAPDLRIPAKQRLLPARASEDKKEWATGVITKGGAQSDLRAKVNALFTVAAAALFGLAIGFVEGPEPASQFYAGYLLELSLSVDNLFVFVLIFDYFQVPTEYQNKVLTYGIWGAVVFRAILIFLGLSAVQAFESVNLIFAAILLFSSFKLLAEGDEEEEDLSNNVIVSFCKKLIPVTDSYNGDNFFILEDTVRKATPLLLALAVVEITDVFFAFDSIPAIFGVTEDPFIVFTSNLFAILGLRSLFTVIANSMADLRFLQPAIAAVLGFIGAKLIADFFGTEIPTGVSLFVVASLLGGGVFLSLRFPKEDKTDSL